MSDSTVASCGHSGEDDTFHLRLPADFQAPREWQGQRCILVPAAPLWVELDYAAVMTSREQLQGLFGAGDAWPPADLTQADDEADLTWHEREFAQGYSFAYSLLSHDRLRCMGCVYVYPTANPEHDAEAYIWASTTEPDELRSAVLEELTQWLAQDWPFTALAWPGRSIPFREWPYSNYYAVRRNAD
ncbi:hypothetical protein [Halopseudomonas sp.]|uniref:hypothetical protein n=1 Tax=Halopseudomonas sp. TaxID=2901191 RepID=UPI003567D189